jgi:hypothetical protein
MNRTPLIEAGNIGSQAENPVQAPLAGGNYTFWRNIKDYGAKGDGSTDDSVAINNAVAAGGRCGEDCGNSFALGAIVYFPVREAWRLPSDGIINDKLAWDLQDLPVHCSVRQLDYCKFFNTSR